MKRQQLILLSLFLLHIGADCAIWTLAEIEEPTVIHEELLHEAIKVATISAQSIYKIVKKDKK